MTRQCDLNEFEDLANAYICEVRDKVEMVEFYGEQMMSLKAENALLKQQLKRLH